MKIVIPLAGPDYIDENGELRAARKLNGIPILKDILDSRPWFQNRIVSQFDDVYFVLQDKTLTREFFNNILQTWYPGCHAVFIPHFTAGAAYSALSAITVFGHETASICIDLADIKFEWQAENPEKILSHLACAGIIPVFKSAVHYYSYVITDENNDIVESREKKVISDQASAGVYFFKSPTDFMYALHYVQQRPELKHNDLVYICPLANAFSNTQKKMKAVFVEAVQDFHRAIL